MAAIGSGCANPWRREDAAFRHKGVRYAYSRWCAGACADEPAAARPVVLVHGFAQSRLSWEETAARLVRRTPGLAVYALDLVGHGDSERPAARAPYDLRAQADALAAFVRSVSFAGAAVFGYSMGGRVALEMACSDPEPLFGLVLESAGAGPCDGQARESFAARNAQWARRLREEGIDSFAAWWGELSLFASQRDLPADVRKRIASGRARNDAEALARTLEQAGAHAMRSEAECVAALRALRARGAFVHYVAGSRDEKYARVARKLEEAGAAQAHIVEGAGHNTHLERPDEFARLAAFALGDGAVCADVASEDRGICEIRGASQHDVKKRAISDSIVE